MYFSVSSFFCGFFGFYRTLLSDFRLYQLLRKKGELYENLLGKMSKKTKILVSGLLLPHEWIDERIDKKQVK